MTRVTAKQRFECKFAKDQATGCWNWLACRDGDARTPTDDPRGRYGRFSLDGYHMIPAHRASYALYRGPIPNGLWVLHRCDNPSCVNPDHLFLGTREENKEDEIRKGRSWHQKPGARSPRLGTGRWLRIGRLSVVPTQCSICNKDVFQRADAYTKGQAPVCSRDCKSVLTGRRSNKRIKVPCHECGTPVERAPCLLKKNKHTFCSRRCLGLNNARNRWHATDHL